MNCSVQDHPNNQRVCYEAQYLLRKILSEIYCSRLQLYSDEKLNVDVHLLE